VLCAAWAGGRQPWVGSAARDPSRDTAASSPRGEPAPLGRAKPCGRRRAGPSSGTAAPCPEHSSVGQTWKTRGQGQLQSSAGLRGRARGHRTALLLLLLLFLRPVEDGKEPFLFCATAFLSPLKDGFNINPIRNFFLVRKTGYCFRILANKAVLEKRL